MGSCDETGYAKVHRFSRWRPVVPVSYGNTAEPSAESIRDGRDVLSRWCSCRAVSAERDPPVAFLAEKARRPLLLTDGESTTTLRYDWAKTTSISPVSCGPKNHHGVSPLSKRQANPENNKRFQPRNPRYKCRHERIRLLVGITRSLVRPDLQRTAQRLNMDGPHFAWEIYHVRGRR